jgi:thiamine kinase-like enzyme
MDIAEEAHVRRTLAGLPDFDAWAAQAARIERLPGLTNRVYLIEGPNGRASLRIPGVGSAAIIDRNKEEANARIAAEIGVAPEILHFGADGVMLTSYIDGIPLSAPTFDKTSAAITRAAETLRRLHDSGRNFSGVFDVFSVNAAYVELLQKRGHRLSEDHRLAVAEANLMRDSLAARKRPLRPCHCDPTGGNLIDTGAKVWLIDWEYSAMNDPLWDLAYLSIQADFDEQQDTTLLVGYRGRQSDHTEAALMEIFKALVELLSALWALVQHSAGNRSADFSGYAAATFSGYRERMGSERFQYGLASLRTK